jgi:hypothetical protein
MDALRYYYHYNCNRSLFIYFFQFDFGCTSYMLAVQCTASFARCDVFPVFLPLPRSLAFYLYHGLINYKDTKEKCRHQ